MARQISLCLLSLVLVAGFTHIASAATWYADPVNGSTAGDGSAANPWPSLEWVVSSNKIESFKPAAYPYVEGDALVARNVGAPVQPGDTIELLSGDHGDVWIVGYFNTDWIKLKAAAGHTPVLQHLIIRGGYKWHIDGVTISKEPFATPDSGILMNFNTHGYHGPVNDCIIENSNIYSVQDSSTWTAADWLSKAPSTGISADGKRITVRKCTLKNVLLGINANRDDCLVENNTLRGIGHDGLRSAGDRIVWQYNKLSDFVDIDGNHDDMIQLYRGGDVPHVGVVIRGNYFDGRKIAGRPLTTSPQGVGCFDGPYVNCVVENNVIMTAHYHGISLYSADNCRILNNTVIDPSREYPAWISIPSGTNCVVRNNISYSIPDSDAAAGNVSDHNIELTDEISDLVFVDWRNGDVHLLADGAAVDTGSSLLAPTEDIDRKTRPFGSGFDIGAYEYTDQQLTPGDVNGDGHVNLDDFIILRQNYGSSDAQWSQGDFNGDGNVNLDDFILLKQNYGT